MGETFYAVLPRTVLGSLKSAWHIEKRRYARKHQHPFRLGNDVLNAWLMSAVLWGALTVWLGVGILPYLVIQASSASCCSRSSTTWSTTACCARRSASPARSATSGSTLRTRWNSNNVATNVLLYHLQRHSDHHANPTRRYQTLRDFEESPVLPTGYAGMIVLALFPPI